MVLSDDREYINIYDFDKTIYDGDSSFDFYLFCVLKKPWLMFNLIIVFLYYILYFFKIISKEQVKVRFFNFLKSFKNIDDVIDEFWIKNNNKIKEFYLKKNHDNDVIISASPKFLLKPIAINLKIKKLIATDVDKNSGHLLGKNCKGKEKVLRLKKELPNILVNETYTDSYSDQPIIDLADHAFLVKKEKIVKIK